MHELGKVLLVLGLLAAAAGALLLWGPRVPFLGRLPGDFAWKRGNVTVYAPLATSILLSLVLTLVLTLLNRRR